jgi:KUP system potassium uptake protein
MSPPPLFDPYVVPIAVAILIGLFLFQSRGTTGVGKVFGPITILWFLAISVLGIHQILRAPGVLAAINPWHGVEFFLNNGGRGFVVLGAVFLVVTGGEALYADIGHFGTAPIRLTWFAIVLPALVLNYLGQGALLLMQPESAVNPFYRLAPSWALYPMVVLATAAAIIASQAIISGAFSLTMQAIQLGYSPRLKVNYTSARIIGQIYVPVVNWVLMLSCIGLRARLSNLEPPRGCLRRSNHHHDVDHDNSILCRGSPPVALVNGGCPSRSRIFSSRSTSRFLAQTCSRSRTAVGSRSLSQRAFCFSC